LWRCDGRHNSLSLNPLERWRLAFKPARFGDARLERKGFAVCDQRRVSSASAGEKIGPYRVIGKKVFKRL
jgi:hypothetical protein